MRHVYVHVPFCRRRCSYCDFAIAVRPRIPDREFASAIEAEIEWRKEGGGWDLPPVETLYFGGGTPSLLGPATLAAIRDGVGAQGAECEVTVEANPDDVTEDAIDGWRAAGVNRVSLGVQTFHDPSLEWMHRTHDSDSAVRAFELLRRRFESVSADIIFGLPGDLERSLEDDLQKLVALQPDHVSAYGLTVEPGSALKKWVDRGAATPVDEESYNREFMLVHDVLAAHGYEHYEISNFALPGRRAQHNSAYWTGASYVGLGPSAHSFDAAQRRRSWNHQHWPAYVRALSDGGPVEEEETLAARQIDLERVYLGLRTDSGISMEILGLDEPLDQFVARGWLKIADNAIKATPSGWLVLDEIVTALTTSGEGG